MKRGLELQDACKAQAPVSCSYCYLQINTVTFHRSQRTRYASRTASEGTQRRIERVKRCALGPVSFWEEKALGFASHLRLILQRVAAHRGARAAENDISATWSFMNLWTTRRRIYLLNGIQRLQKRAV